VAEQAVDFNVALRHVAPRRQANLTRRRVENSEVDPARNKAEEDREEIADPRTDQDGA
jgi:hypothetical protein